AARGRLAAARRRLSRQTRLHGHRADDLRVATHPHARAEPVPRPRNERLLRDWIRSAAIADPAHAAQHLERTQRNRPGTTARRRPAATAPRDVPEGPEGDRTDRSMRARIAHVATDSSSALASRL